MNQSSPRNMTCIMHDKMVTQIPTWINKSTSMTQGWSQSLASTRLAVGNSCDFTKHTGDVQLNWHKDIIPTTDLVLKVVEDTLLIVDRFEKAMEFILRVYLVSL